MGLFTSIKNYNHLYLLAGGDLTFNMSYLIGVGERDFSRRPFLISSSFCFRTAFLAL